MKNYYITKSGRLSRKDNSVIFEYHEDCQGKHIPIPINDIDSIYLFGEVDLNTKLINFLSQNNVMVHFFNYYGYYTGSFYPKEFLCSGEVVVRQSEKYLNGEERLYLAKEMIFGGAYGMVQNLKRHKEAVGEMLSEMEGLQERIVCPDINSIESLMGIEGNIRETYYKAFPKIIVQEIEFEKRVKNPPDNMMNALISFVNSLIYTETLKEIYKTQLNPTVSFLHEPSYRRFSLSLDVSEIFKPIYGDRIIFDLLNNRQLTKEHFDKEVNYAYLKESGRKIVLQAFDEKLSTTIMHRKLRKKVSYRQIIRLELYKLIKHILDEERYKSFRIWW